MSFCKDFLWGAASAATQTEGAWNKDGRGEYIRAIMWPTVSRALGDAVSVLRANCPNALVGLAPTGDCYLPENESAKAVEEALPKIHMACGDKAPFAITGQFYNRFGR